MELEKIEDILVARDRLDLRTARELVNEARVRVADGEDPEEILYEEFGLEPDYVFQLL